MSRLAIAALAFAAAEADDKVRETGGNNFGPRIKWYLDNLEPPLPQGTAWCAAFIQWVWDRAAKLLGVPNPLNTVKHEALVQSYYDHLKDDVLGGAVNPEPGDLVLFKFPRDGKLSETWNHIGQVAQVGPGTSFISIEGNTGDVNQRDGDGVYEKPRDSKKQPTCFIRVRVT